MAIFLALYILTSILIYSLSVRLMVGSVDAVMEATAQPLVAEVSTSFNRGQFPTEFVKLTKLSSLYPKVSVIILRDALGHVIASTNPQIKSNFPYDFPDAKTSQTTVESPSHQYYRVLTKRIMNPYKQTEGFLQIGLNIDRDLAGLKRLSEVLWMVAIAGTALAAVAGLYMSQLTLRPIVRSWQQQQQFVADASHELRTPLSIIQLNLEVMTGDPTKTIGENMEWIEVIAKETHRLRRLTQDLLTLARLGAPREQVELEAVNLPELLASVVNSFQLSASAKGLQLTLQAHLPQDEVVATRGNPDRLYQLFTILIDNAVKYTNHGEVTVSMEKKRSHVHVAVKDSGIGIAAAQIGYVFDRFYRTDAARVRATGGSGLGLSIAKMIVDEHAGKIFVHSSEGQGTMFTVHLPTI